MLQLQQSEGTAAQRRIPFMAVDATDGFTPEPGLTITTIEVSENGAAQAAGGGSITEIGDGQYYYEATAAELSTLGFLTISIRNAAMRDANLFAQVVPYDPYDAVRMGLTALPNANAEAAGGLYTRGTGAGQINQPSNGIIDAEVQSYDSSLDFTATQKTSIQTASDSAITANTDINNIDTGVNNLETNVPDIISLANINAEIDTALADIRLDELINTAAGGVAQASSFIDIITSKNISQTFDPLTDSLEAIVDAGGGTDWTSGEKDQIRFRLAMDGSQTDPTTGTGTIEDILAKTNGLNFTGSEVDANITKINGGLTTGYNASLKLAQLDIQNSGGSALIAKSTGGAGHGIEAEGNGASAGMQATGGATGQGMHARGGITQGYGFQAEARVSPFSGALFSAVGVGHGVFYLGGSGGGSGILSWGQGAGSAMVLQAQGAGKDIAASEIDDIKAVTDVIPNSGAMTDIDTGINNLETNVPDVISLANINIEVDNALDTDIPAVPTAGSINDVLNDLDGKLPSGTISDITTTQVNAEVDNALDTAIPGTPTADSINDVLADLDGVLPSSTISDFDETADPVELLDTGGTAGTSAEELVDDVWDELLTGALHNLNTSSGKRLRQIQENLLYEDGAVWVDTINGTLGTVDFENGTVGLPSKTIADAKIIADSLNLKRFRIVNGSSLTLAAAFDGYEFFGIHWTIALGNQSISDTVVDGASVSGICTGANKPHFNNCDIGNVTLPACHMHDSIYSGDIIMADAGDYHSENCNSGIAGTGTPSFDFGAAVVNTNLNMRHYSGGVEVKNMGGAGTDNMSLEGHGQLVINANCTGGTIAIRGDFQRTDNASNLVTIVDADIHTIHKFLNNRLELDTSDDLKLYDDDGTTLLKTWAVTDETGSGLSVAAGVPARRANPT